MTKCLQQRLDVTEANELTKRLQNSVY